MRVRLRTIMAGPAGTGQPGQVVDLPDGQAEELLRSHQAVPAEQPTERAVAPAEIETADAAPARRTLRLR